MARFIRAEAVFYFDQMYRPVPLRITVTGFKKNSRRDDENRYLIEKVTHFMKRKKQVLVFVHSRARTMAVAKTVLENLLDSTISALNDSDGNKKDRRRLFFASNALNHLVQAKIGIHHAGMPRTDID